jgi:hypothetical protein
MRWRTAVTDDPDDKTQGRFGLMSRGRHLVSPPNWATTDVMLVIKEMGHAPDLRAAVRSALKSVMADGKGRYDIGVLGRSPASRSGNDMTR